MFAPVSAPAAAVAIVAAAAFPAVAVAFIEASFKCLFLLLLRLIFSLTQCIQTRNIPHLLQVVGALKRGRGMLGDRSPPPPSSLPAIISPANNNGSNAAVSSPGQQSVVVVVEPPAEAEDPAKVRADADADEESHEMANMLPASNIGGSAVN